MDVHRIKKNVETISFALLQKYQVSAKFKVRLYHSQGDSTKYYHQIYQKNPRSATRILTTTQYIEISLRDEAGNSDYFIINELYRNRFIRKIIKLANALDAYDAGEVDILVESQNGTRLHSDLAKEVSISLGTQDISIIPIFDGSKVSVSIMYHDIKCMMTIQDFIIMINKIKDINFSMMAANLITYHEACDDGNVNQSNSESFVSQTPEVTGGSSGPAKSSIWDINEPQVETDFRKVKW